MNQMFVGLPPHFLSLFFLDILLCPHQFCHSLSDSYEPDDDEDVSPVYVQAQESAAAVYSSDCCQYSTPGSAEAAKDTQEIKQRNGYAVAEEESDGSNYYLPTAPAPSEKEKEEAEKKQREKRKDVLYDAFVLKNGLLVERNRTDLPSDFWSSSEASSDSSR